MKFVELAEAPAEVPMRPNFARWCILAAGGGSLPPPLRHAPVTSCFSSRFSIFELLHLPQLGHAHAGILQDLVSVINQV
jgi:hypothetical protein